MTVQISQLNTILMVFTWFPLAGLLAILLMIARYFETHTRINVAYRLFLLPILLFGVAVITLAAKGQVLAVPLADGLFMLGGLTLAGLCVGLYRRMISQS